jgi:hypothetical protein
VQVPSRLAKQPGGLGLDGTCSPTTLTLSGRKMLFVRGGLTDDVLPHTPLSYIAVQIWKTWEPAHLLP